MLFEAFKSCLLYKDISKKNMDVSVCLIYNVSETFKNIDVSETSIFFWFLIYK